MSASGLGSLLGLATLVSVVRRLSSGVALGGILVLGGVLYAPLALVDSLPAALVVIFIAGVVSSPFYVVIRSAKQRLIPKHIRGRVIGAGGVLGVAGFPFGRTLGGLALASLSVSSVIMLSAAALAVLGASVFAVPALRAPSDSAEHQRSTDSSEA